MFGNIYKKNPDKALLLIMVVSASVLLVPYLGGMVFEKYGTSFKQASDSTVTAQGVFSEEYRRGLPIRLDIPKLGINAKIGQMGVTKTGAMAVPANIVDVGWYKYSARPGNTGSAVIAGHLDGPQGQPGVFGDLDKLKKGDQVLVIDNKNHTASFVVREVKVYDQNAQPAEVFRSRDGIHLNLITCTGTWDVAQHGFLTRLVVFTDRSG